MQFGLARRQSKKKVVVAAMSRGEQTERARQREIEREEKVPDEKMRVRLG